LSQRDMTLDGFECVVRAFPAVRTILMQGEGEPLLHPDFFEMVALAKAVQPAVNISTVTNGSLFSADRADRLVELSLHDVGVSIESGDPRVFREIRGGSLENVTEGVRTLLAARNRRGASRPTVRFAVTILRRTLGELPAIVSLYEKLGLDGGITIQRLQAMPVYTRYYSEAMQSQCLSPQDRGELAGWIRSEPRMQQALARAEEVGREALGGRLDAPPGQCPWLTRGLYIAADGMALACCYQKVAVRDGFGIIGRTPIDQILAGRRQWADAFNCGVLPEGCRGCSMASILIEKRGGRSSF